MSNQYLLIIFIIYTCLDLQEVRLESSSNNQKIFQTNGSLSNNELLLQPPPKVIKINQEKKPIPPELTNTIQVNENNHVNKVISSAIEESKKPATTGGGGDGEQIIQQSNIALTTDTFIRGFYVFMGFGIVILVYLGIKTIRVNQPPTPDTTVRKYGIKAKRGDLEMLPLPLAEDEEDDTLFDVGNHVVRTGN